MRDRKINLSLLSYLFSGAITVVVYMTGGTNKVYPNMMYIPIAVMASVYGKWQGVIHAVICGLLMGPFMPLDKDLHINQETVNWMVRLLIYAIIALVISYFSDFYREEFAEKVKKEKEIADAQMAVVYAMAKLAEFRDSDTGGHIERVTELCRLLTTNLRRRGKYREYIDDDYIEKLTRVSPLHDIGKVGIADKILLKPGRLTAIEFELMKTHTTIGAKTILEVKEKFPDNRLLELAINITNFHHERWDGAGYPLGLAGTEIPLSARIMAIVDVYDALRSKRVYKEAFSHENSLKIIQEESGKAFDPEIVMAFLEIAEEVEKIFTQYEKKRVVSRIPGRKEGFFGERV
ncbi:MAG TPA: HD domain-containing protein [Firmicutes bacterium]|nr:HD domain-containing protein [Bacillota bacterium]